MANENIHQVYVANPITSNASTDLMYFGQSPYTSGADDAAMTFANFAAQFGSPYTAAALTKVNDTNVTLTLGGTPATSLLQAVSLTLGWTGDLAITRGGTGVGSVTIAPTASAWAGWDANSNLSANNFLAGYSTTSSTGTTTLLVGSSYLQYFTGATGTCKMPVVTTLALGQAWLISAGSGSTITIESSGANTIGVVSSGGSAIVTCILLTGTTAASWNIEYLTPSTATTNLVLTWGGSNPVWSNPANNALLKQELSISAFITSSTITGTVNAIVATTAYAFTGGYTDGMLFSLDTGGNTNTSTSVTLAINANAAETVYLSNGNAIAVGDINNGALVQYNSTLGGWILINPAVSSISSPSPWKAGTGTGSAKGGDGSESVAGNYSLVYGINSCSIDASTQAAFIFGNNVSTSNGSSYSLLFGINSTLNSSSASLCYGNTAHIANANYAFAAGDNINVNASFGFGFGVSCTVHSAYGWAVGNGSVSNNQGSMVWSDSTGSSPAQDSSTNQWVQSFRGGYYWYTGTTPTLALQCTSSGVIALGTNTNDNASSGYVGEFITSNIPFASSVSFSNGAADNLTSISLTAGDWDVWGNINYDNSGLLESVSAWISTTSATLPDASLYNSIGATGLDATGISAPTIRLSLAATTTVFLSGQNGFSTGTLTGCGTLSARRVR